MIMDIHSASYFLLPFCFLCPTLHIQKPWQCYNIHLWGLPNNIICLWHSDSTLSYFFLIKIFYALFKFNVHLTGGGGIFQSLLALTFRAFSSISLSFCLSLTLAYLLLLSMVGRTFSSARLLLKLIKSFQCW